MTGGPVAAARGRRSDRASYSLRRRLVGAILGASVLVWIVGLAIVVAVAWHETNAVFDDALKEGARLTLVLGASLRSQGALAGDDPVVEREPAKLKLYYQIVDGEGRVLRRADKAPPQPFLSPPGPGSGYRDAWVDGQAWRVYVLRTPGQPFHVQMGQPWDERLELFDEMADALIWPAGGLLAALAVTCWWVVRRLLQPIERTARRIATKSPDDLEPVATVGEPRELQPLVRAFNLVLDRLQRALLMERRFTADAAHELRTPLAALRMRIQLLERLRSTTAAPPARDELRALRDDVDRCTTLVESLLALARLDPAQPATLRTESVDLAALFERLEDAVPGEPRRRLEIDCRAPVVEADAALLQSALRNIVDNARRYGAPDGRVRLESSRVAGRVRIAVRDDGPGVGDADRRRLGERFFRVLGTARSGSGLGLSIVARIAALHSATLSFETGLDGRGLGVVMEFRAE